MTPGRPVRAVLFDVDGTLYRQDALRMFMSLELAAAPILKNSCGEAITIWRTLSVFRRVREELRGQGAPAEPLRNLQFTAAAARLGVEPSAVESIVSEWIFKRPLKYLRLCRSAGVERFIDWLAANKLAIGMFSDYPVREKVDALGLPGKASLELCATDPEINAFKPHPAGYLYACLKWGLPPDQVLYVGDRADIDAAGAVSAGMPCAIVTRSVSKRSENSYGALFISSFAELNHAFLYRVNH